jgi:hypothetical protein
MPDQSLQASLTREVVVFVHADSCAVRSARGRARGLAGVRRQLGRPRRGHPRPMAAGVGGGATPCMPAAFPDAIVRAAPGRTIRARLQPADGGVARWFTPVDASDGPSIRAILASAVCSAGSRPAHGAGRRGSPSPDQARPGPRAADARRGCGRRTRLVLREPPEYRQRDNRHSRARGPRTGRFTLTNRSTPRSWTSRVSHGEPVRAVDSRRPRIGDAGRDTKAGRGAAQALQAPAGHHDRPVEIYDTAARRQPGPRHLVFRARQTRIAERLDAFGSTTEGGWPARTGTWSSSEAQAAHVPACRLAAFGATRRKGRDGAGRRPGPPAHRHETP